MAAEPPRDFEHYKEWRRTPEGIAWFQQQASKHHDRFVCENPICGTVVWWPKSEVIDVKTIPCVYPCTGTLRRQREPQFWEGEREQD